MDNAIPFFKYEFLRRGIVLAAAITTVCSATPVSASIFMQVPDVKGEAMEEGHKDWIELTSLQFGVGRSIATQTGGGGDRTPSAPVFSEIAITKMSDITTPLLLNEVTSGKGKKVVIHFTRLDKGTSVVYQTLELENVLFSSYSQSSGGDRPSESLSLNFTKISMTYKSDDEQRTENFDFDLTTVQAGTLSATTLPTKNFTTKSVPTKKAP